MSFDNDQFVADYLTKGMYVFNADSVLSHVDIEQFKPVTVKHEDDCFHAEGHEFHDDYQTKMIQEIREWLTFDALKEFSCVLQFDFFAPEVNLNVRHWHGDPEYNMPGQNTSINCFFDDTSEELGGAFEMIPYSKQPDDNDPRKVIVYPKKHDVIIFNQNRNFLHRAKPSKNPRRMISYGCTFLEFNTILPTFMES